MWRWAARLRRPCPNDEFAPRLVGRNIYGLFHLYELTGEVRYLERGMNAMGACAQLMGLDGTLRWAFVPDPQRQARDFCKG